MHSKYLQFLLLRVLFPATLLITIAMRPYGMSVVYVLLLILSPPFPIKTANNARLLQVTTGISICLLIVHLIWHIILAVFVPYASILKSYPHARIIGHNLGLVSYKHNISVVKATFYMAPEIFLSSSSLTLLFLLKRITHISRAKKFQTHPFLTACGKYVVLLLIMCSGILNPNMISSIYFLVFLILGTWWALNKSLVKVLAVIGRCLMPILALHTLLLLLYQCTWALENFPPDDGLARFLGLIKIAHIDVFSPEETWYEGPRTGRSEHRFTMYATPLVMLLTYYCLGLETSELFKPKVKIVTGLEGGTKGNGAMVPGVSFMKPKEKWASTTNKVAIPFISSKVLRGTRSETTPFTRNTSLSKHTKWASISRQISTGSIIIDQESVRQSNTVVAEIGRTVIDFFQITIRSSYIATTIIMMAWSIMYHSWLTFVLLMWANFVWLTPNQRSTMLRSSPILVVYAIGLLIIQYLYSMNLSESELPSTSGVEGINFKQIGMIRMATEAPFKPLLIKCLFMCMFWITLKQWMQERKGMPPRLSTTEWGEALEMPSTVGSEREKSRLFQKLGTFLRHMCVRYWIYVVAIMLFVIGITGERMTIFRIIYMFLFLVFILLFQISWYLWRLMMYVFWIVLIFYSMIYLILTYIYQFDEFSNLIEKYLYIDKKLQRDLGLDAYDRADLFLKLLTPTSFLIITIIQVHYFHKDFMAYSDPKTYHKRDSKIDTLTGPSQDASTMKDDIPQLPLEGGRGVSPTADRRSIRSLTPEASKYSQSYTGTSRRQSLTFRAWVLLKFINFKKYVKVIFDLTIAYLELHMIKIIFVSLMLLCAFDVCALHVPIMLVICPGLWMHSRNQRGWVLVMSTLISIYLMVRMVYQINYIDPTSFLTTCDSVPYNNAHWVGFKKLAKGENLSSLLKGYIGLIAVFIVHSLILYRHDSYKGQIGVATVSKVMFPNIRREDADKNMITCIKYLTNYGFYKFGVEITLICMMGVIGSRMDMYALIYAFWLLTLVTMHRRQQARVWRVFTSYITLIIPVQYCLAVGVLPYFCIKYPWDGNSDKLKQIRSFLYLPHADDPPHGVKLIFDYFLLLFASLQLKVFRREELYGESYAGGSNSEIIGQHWETPNFVNPIPDFTGFVGTWLDVTKRVIFLGMLWVTLAIMFMTGTNRVNLFSMGYLIGSFIFLWQGTDFYLLPKKVILAWWSWLLRYNVTVVVIKTLLQIAGCIYGSVLQAHACWLVQLLGIGCVDKFAGHSLSKFLKMDYIKNEVCSVPQEDIGLAWDGVCFAFLILQKRMFYSYYFYRVIDESKATTILASRGAELIEELRQKQMRLQKELEVDILRNIKLKMEKIKANQRKIQGITKEPFLTHEIEGDEEGTSQQVPLVRGDSDASARGYHTPDSPASPRGFHTPISEASAPPSPHHSPPTTPRDSPSTSTPPADPSLAPLPAIPAPLSSHGGPPSPSSALLTSLSLDAYLEPRRISFGSPPSSELLPRAQSPEESYPVFSPPPIRRRHTVASPSLLQRTSIISQSSRSEPKSHQTSRRSDCPPYRTPKSHQHALRSGDYYMFDDFDDTELVVAKKNVLEEDADAPKGMGLGTLLSALIRADLKRTLAVRRATMPGPRQRRSSWRQVTSQPVSAHEEISVGPPFRRAASERGMGAGELPERGPPGEGSSGGRRPGEGPTNEEPTGEGAISSTSVEPIKETWFDKIMQVFDCVGAFISSSLISITRQLMKYSRDYRYVSRTLTYEKKLLKEREGFGIGIREGTQLRWEPIPESIGIVRKLSDISVPEIRILAPSMERGLDASLAPSRCASPSPPHTPTPEEDDTSEHESAFTLQSTESKDISLLADNDDSMFTRQRWPIVLLAYAFWYAILAHTDIVCYLMVFINQIQSATILSIPLPLMVFLWGTLTIPRPTKTFWVTLIAYTEVIVLIKSMFQFEILPWNQKAIPVNMPFTAPRIIGIERKSNYALYDLLLLLIIFLHRFMLKSLGLWKESTPEVELREDMQFNLTPEDTNNLVEGNGTEVGQKYVKIHRQTGPSHRLVNHLRHVETAIEGVMRELKATRSDPRVVQRVNERLQLLRAAMRRKYAAKGRKPQASGSQALSTADLKVDEEDTASVDLPNTETDAAPGSSKPPDDEYYKVDDDKEPIIAVTTTLEAPYSRCPSILWLSLKRYIRPPQDFFKRMMQPMARVTADIYAYMFLCDFINFLIVIFGFAAFGTHQGDGGVQAYLEENKVPIPFLVMLILQFALIVIDRALYLRKFMLGKILFQYALIIGVHVWMFFILPFITERTFNTLAPPPLWYMVKCVYLLLSAYQIRCGYPCRIIGNFLCKSYNYVNMLAFRLFMAVPFVFELRTMMDWIWTDTSMALMDWLKMEDIFASLFLLKCGRYLEKEYPQDRGQKKAKTAKYILGGGVLTFIIAIIWFPLVFFAFGNRVGASNPPTDVTVKIRIGPYLPVYQMSAQSYNIQLFTQQEYAQLSNMYLRDRTAQTFLSNYMYDDLAVVTLNPNSTMMWAISPPEQDRLEREAKSNQTLVVKFTFVITHPSNNAQNPPTIEDSREVDLPALVYGKRDPERDILYNMLLNKSDPDTWLKVPTLFPKFLKVFNKGTAKPAFQLSTTNLDIVPTESYETTDKRKYRDVLMRLERDRGTMYWRVKEKCSSRDLLMAIPKNNCDMLVMYTFNDKLFPETLNFISGGGIIGLYTTFVFLASRVIRGFFSGIYTKIMFDDMPNVDRVLQLCLDIYLVREALELSLEEDLFAKLVFLYRSPETMIKWSRMKEDPDERQSQREAVQRAMPPDT